jgi:hypothetical protein
MLSMIKLADGAASRLEGAGKRRARCRPRMARPHMRDGKHERRQTQRWLSQRRRGLAVAASESPFAPLVQAQQQGGAA